MVREIRNRSSEVCEKTADLSEICAAPSGGRGVHSMNARMRQRQDQLRRKCQAARASGDPKRLRSALESLHRFWKLLEQAGEHISFQDLLKPIPRMTTTNAATAHQGFKKPCSRPFGYNSIMVRKSYSLEIHAEARNMIHGEPWVSCSNYGPYAK